MRRYIVCTSLLSLGLALLAGCGQKGPLVLPPRPATTAPHASAKAAAKHAVPASAASASAPSSDN